jgi:putative Holliday junction resolvase
MKSDVYLGFDFGCRRIGVAVGQKITRSTRPLTTLSAKQGVPNWQWVEKIINEWQPSALIVGLPRCIDDSEQYTTTLAKSFSKKLFKRFNLPVHLVDERLSTVEARARIFAEGGYRKLQATQIDSVAASIILEQWLQDFI